jgi:hypothetical protein
MVRPRRAVAGRRKVEVLGKIELAQVDAVAS